jgi:hypothetical protein
MPVRYDTDDGFTIDSETCEDCGSPLYDTGCDARGCNGFCCMECGTGCDIEFAPEDGRCATALAEESDEDYDARVNAERAAFGLSPVATEAGEEEQ